MTRPFASLDRGLKKTILINLLAALKHPVNLEEALALTPRTYFLDSHRTRRVTVSRRLLREALMFAVLKGWAKFDGSTYARSRLVSGSEIDRALRSYEHAELGSP